MIYMNWIQGEAKNYCSFEDNLEYINEVRGFLGGASDKELTCQCRRHKGRGFDPCAGKIPWRKAWKRKFSSVQSLSRVGLFATPWIAARQASLSITISRSSLRLTGNPLQYSCLENPTDRGAWWATYSLWGSQRVGHDWRRQWHPTPVLLPGKSHGRRSLVGCSPWGRYESDTMERLHFHFSLSRIGEGNGNPLQCSCLENPRDRGAW